MSSGSTGDAGADSRSRCAGCGQPLAPHQRYCIGCGERVGALSVPGAEAADPSVAAAQGPEQEHSAQPPPTVFGKPLPNLRSLNLRPPSPRSAGAIAALSLAFGVFVGLAMGPAFPGAGLATSRFVVQVPGTSTDDGAQASAGAGAASATLGSPVGNVGGAPAPTTKVVKKAPAPSTPPATPPPQTPGDGKAKKGHDHRGPPRKPHEKPSVTGTVVNVNPVAQSYTVARDEGGAPAAIHADDLPDAGTKVKVGVRKLFNGTYAERGERSDLGTSDSGFFTATVTYLDYNAGVYTASAPGASLLVHAPAGEMPSLGDELDLGVSVDVPAKAKHHRRAKARAHARHHRRAKAHRRRARSGGPVWGALERVFARATDNCTDQPIEGPGPSAVLHQDSFLIEGFATGPVDIEGIVERACPASEELELSADDIRASGKDIVLPSPAAVDLSLLEPGKAVDVTAKVDLDGSYELTGVSSDDGVAGANDSATGQGDQAAD
jgi:hypothetical protein